jgi:hypothetical protein
MAFKKPEEVEEKLELIIKSVLDFKGLVPYLQNCEDWQERWSVLEEHVADNLGSYGLKPIDWGLFAEDFGFLRDRFFYEMQQRTGMDFGFCRHFIPAYKERTRYFLSGSKEDPEKNWDKCSFGGKEEETVCNGTSREYCVFLNKERK